MTLQNLIAKLEHTGYPVALDAFQADDMPAFPYIIYSVGDREPFYADGVVYFSQTAVAVMMRCSKKDLIAEQHLIDALGLQFSGWSETYDETENCYTYTVTVNVTDA